MYTPRTRSVRVQHIEVGDVIWSMGALERRTAEAIEIKRSSGAPNRLRTRMTFRITWSTPTGEKVTHNHPATATFLVVSE